MKTIYYIVNNYELLQRGLPHYSAILQAMDALVRCGRRVVLVMPRQNITLEELRTIYGVEGLFEIHWTRPLSGIFQRQILSNIIACLYVWRAMRPGDAAYTRYLPAACLGVAGRRVFVEMHQWFWQSRKQQLGYRAIIKLLLLFDLGRHVALVPITKAMQDLMPEWMFRNRTSMVAGSGVSASLAGKSSARGDGPPVFFYAGTFEAQKGMAFMYRLANAAPHYRFIFVGCPEEQRAAVEAEFRHDNVELLGRVAPSEMRRLLERADYGLLLNDPHSGWLNRVTSPLKLFEYMMAGKVVVASDLQAIREVVRDGEQALLVDPYATEAILARVEELEADPVRREALVRAARQTALEHSWDRRAQRIVAVMDQTE